MKVTIRTYREPSSPTLDKVEEQIIELAIKECLASPYDVNGEHISLKAIAEALGKAAKFTQRPGHFQTVSIGDEAYQEGLIEYKRFKGWIS